MNNNFMFTYHKLLSNVLFGVLDVEIIPGNPTIPVERTNKSLASRLLISSNISLGKSALMVDLLSSFTTSAKNIIFL